MTEEKPKSDWFAVDMLINIFSKPLTTIAFVISFVFLILFYLHGPTCNVISEKDSLKESSISNPEVKLGKIRSSSKKSQIMDHSESEKNGKSYAMHIMHICSFSDAL